METASFRIKFSPFIQNYQKKDSKCCLEIVPDVTCVQNLEKITWEQKSDFLEYTVPMTYKVIIRKKQGVKESYHDLEKVYHSCVDLLSTTSSICNSLGGGDSTKINSDSFIYDKATLHSIENIAVKSNTELKPVTILNKTLDTEEHNAKNSNTELKSVTILSKTNNNDDKKVDAITVIEKSLDDLSVEHINITINDYSVTKVDASTSQLLIKNVDSAVKDFDVKIACTSCSKIMLYKESKTDLEGTEISSGTNNENSQNSFQKLSITPIYSIDTIENIIDLNTSFRTPYCASYRFTRPHKMFNETVTIQEVLDNNCRKERNKDISDIIGICNKPNKFRTFKRELPEVRVADFKKKMETEIMPLKIMLYDILDKCETMGLIFKNFRLEDDSKTKLNKQILKYCTSEKQTISNRVVYSIVFDG